MCCDRSSSPKGVVVTRRKGGLGGLTDAAVQVALVAVTWQVRPKAALRPLHGDWQAASRVGQGHSHSRCSASTLGGSLADCRPRGPLNSVTGSALLCPGEAWLPPRELSPSELTQEAGCFLPPVTG